MSSNNRPQRKRKAEEEDDDSWVDDASETSDPPRSATSRAREADWYEAAKVAMGQPHSKRKRTERIRFPQRLYALLEKNEGMESNERYMEWAEPDANGVVNSLVIYNMMTVSDELQIKVDTLMGELRKHGFSVVRSNKDVRSHRVSRFHHPLFIRGNLDSVAMVLRKQKRSKSVGSAGSGGGGAQVGTPNSVDSDGSSSGVRASSNHHSTNGSNNNYSMNTSSSSSSSSSGSSGGGGGGGGEERRPRTVRFPHKLVALLDMNMETPWEQRFMEWGSPNEQGITNTFVVYDFATVCDHLRIKVDTLMGELRKHGFTTTVSTLKSPKAFRFQAFIHPDFVREDLSRLRLVVRKKKKKRGGATNNNHNNNSNATTTTTTTNNNNNNSHPSSSSSSSSSSGSSNARHMSSSSSTTSSHGTSEESGTPVSAEFDSEPWTGPTATMTATPLTPGLLVSGLARSGEAKTLGGGAGGASTSILMPIDFSNMPLDVRKKLLYGLFQGMDNNARHDIMHTLHQMHATGAEEEEEEEEEEEVNDKSTGNHRNNHASGGGNDAMDSESAGNHHHGGGGGGGGGGAGSGDEGGHHHHNKNGRRESSSFMGLGMGLGMGMGMAMDNHDMVMPVMPVLPFATHPALAQAAALFPWQDPFEMHKMDDGFGDATERGSFASSSSSTEYSPSPTNTTMHAVPRLHSVHYDLEEVMEQAENVAQRERRQSNSLAHEDSISYDGGWQGMLASSSTP